MLDYFTLEGTHRGEFLGVPAMDKRVKYEGMHIFSFANGKIVSHWNALDLLSLMLQIGEVVSTSHSMQQAE